MKKKGKKLSPTDYQKIGKQFVEAFGKVAEDILDFSAHQVEKTKPNLANLIKSLPIKEHSDLTKWGNVDELRKITKYIDCYPHREELEVWPAGLIFSAFSFFYEENLYDAIYDLVYAYKYITLLWVLSDLDKDENISIEEQFYEEAIRKIRKNRAKVATKKRIENATIRRSDRDQTVKMQANIIGWNTLGLFQMADELRKLPAFKSLSSESIRDSLRRLDYQPRKTGKKKIP